MGQRYDRVENDWKIREMWENTVIKQGGGEKMRKDCFMEELREIVRKKKKTRKPLSLKLKNSQGWPLIQTTCPIKLTVPFLAFYYASVKVLI